MTVVASPGENGPPRSEGSRSRADAGGGSAAELVAAAAVLLTAALGVSAGFLDHAALLLTTVATALATIAARRVALPTSTGGHVAAAAILSVGLAVSVLRHLQPVGVAVAAGGTTEYRVVVVAAAVVLASYAWCAAPRSIRRLRFPAILALVAVLGALAIAASPAPRIDVWHYQRLGVAALLHGDNPYGVGYPNIYGPGTRFIDPSLLSPDGRWVTAFPYTPLTLLADLPGALAGDVRWSLLVAALLAACLVRALGKGSIVSELAGALLLLQPQGIWVLERSWTEPLALATTLAGALVVAKARAWIGPGVALGLAAASKQYAPLLVAPLWLTLGPPRRWRSLAVAAAITAASLLPFAVWDAAGLVRGLLEFQIRQPFRPDALSWPAMVLQLGGPQLPSWPAFAVAVLVLAVAAWHTTSVGQALLASAAAWTAFVLLSKQAFCNYYWLSVGLLCGCVALVTTAPLRQRGETSPRTGAGTAVTGRSEDGAL